MKEEFNLSELGMERQAGLVFWGKVVKEFIKRLKEKQKELSNELSNWREYDEKFQEEINKLAGKKLCQ